jgi:hypothetical protein
MMTAGGGRRATGDGRYPAAILGLTALLVLIVFDIGSAQRPGRRNNAMDSYFSDPDGYYTPPDFHGNHPYDGRFTFARIKYRGYAHFTQEGPGWSHDYPRAESHLMMILRELTAMRPFTREGNIFGGNIFALDDPELFKYPVAYFSEPGGWFPNDKEVEGMRNYLLKGGVVIFDDFGGNDWFNVVEQFQRVLPKAKILPLDKSHPIFDSFFKIDPDHIPWTRDVAYRGQPQFLAIFEDNDPRKRPIAIFNKELDIGEAWEFSDEGFMPVEMSNEAYKLGVNYIMYALTH